jgi:UDP-N-acetyl-2-amino-2-deoxyglucuronate dehydrogenase
MKRFGLIGAAGYVAPRHMKAIRDTGNVLVAAMDPSDSVGIIDSYFPDADFFVEFERFDRHVDLLRRRGKALDYVSICSPNYLHDSHIRFALRSRADAICEKPMVLNPRNLDALREIERESDGRVWAILQLRLHPAVVALREMVRSGPQDKKFDVDLTYVTSRGHWYHYSWKGDEKKSGGISTNIGVHFFDMLNYVFGDRKESVLHYSDPSTAAGYLEYEHGRVRWLLSVDQCRLPAAAIAAGQRTYRSISVDGEQLEFSGGFDDLHTRSYEEILSGRGFGIDDNVAAIETVAEIRRMKPVGHRGDEHPLLAGATRNVASGRS